MEKWLNTHPVGAVLFLTLILVLWWMLLMTLVSYMSGWNLLAQQFRLNSTFGGQIWRWQGAQMRWLTHYNGCLAVGADPLGLYLAIMFPFRFGHPPLFIPWSEISVSGKKIFFVEYVQFRLGREFSIPLGMRKKLADKIKNAAGPVWPVETIEETI